VGKDMWIMFHFHCIHGVNSRKIYKRFLANGELSSGLKKKCVKNYYKNEMRLWLTLYMIKAGTVDNNNSSR
jgi:hypothetical protein